MFITTVLILTAALNGFLCINLDDKTTDQVYNYNQQVTLSCSFNSAVPVSITWELNGTPVGSSTSGAIYTIPTTDYLQQLVISKLTEQYDGTYTCIGTNSEGTNSGNIRVDIQETGPVIISPFDDVYLEKDQPFTINCIAQGHPTPSLTWRKKNGLLDANIKDNGIGVLEIIKMRPEDEGVYECVAENTKDRDVKQLKLFYSNSTSFVAYPEPDINIKHGDKTQFVVSVQSTGGKPKFLWFKDKNPTPPANYVQKRSGVLYTSVYTIKSATVADAGDYKVSVDGLITSMTKDFQVTVWASPIVTIDREEELVPLNSKAHFICRVNAYPTPDIKWLRNGTVVSRDEINQTFSTAGQRSSLSFYIPSVSESHAATYTCFANNSQGVGDDTVKLVVDVPAPPGEDDDNTTIIIIVVVISVVIILFIIVLVFLYNKYRDRFFGRVTGNGKFYTDLVQEEKDASCLADIENNPYAIKKNINISIRQSERSASVGQQGRLFSLGGKQGSSMKPNLTFKNRSMKNSVKSPTSPVQEQHYAPLDAAVTQGKPIDFKRLQIDEMLGEGEYGLVSGGRLLDEDDATAYKDVSVKMLKENYTAGEKRDILAELRMMRRISRHPNVIAFVGWCITDDNVYVIEEYAPFGSVLTFLRAQRSLSQSTEHLDELPVEDRVDQKTLLSFAWQTASGMKHLANLQIVHRDLACRNVYLGHEKTCKISEYGLARDIYAENVYRKTTGGQLPVRWMSYESVFQGVYTTESDVVPQVLSKDVDVKFRWSFGILLWELVTLGKIPYPGIVRTEQLLDELESGYHMENPGHISTDLYLLMNSCWNREGESRPTFDRLTRQLGDLMKDESEVHIDLEKLHQLEIEADEDFVAPSNEENNRLPSHQIQTIPEDEERPAGNENDNGDNDDNNDNEDPDVIVANNSREETTDNESKSPVA